MVVNFPTLSTTSKNGIEFAYLYQDGQQSENSENGLQFAQLQNSNFPTKVTHGNIFAH